MNDLFNVEALRAMVRELVRDELSTQRASDDYMTAAEAASVARLRPATIREWVRTGRLRAQRIGRQLRVTRADLDAAIANSARGPAKRETAEERGRRLADRVLGR